MHLPRVALAAGLFSLALAVPLTAAADTYDYTYTETASAIDTFTFDSPVLITTDTTFTPLTCSTTNADFGACTSVEIDPGATAGNPQIAMTFANDYLTTTGLSDSFFAVGDNTADSGEYVMDIVDVPSVPAITPEPASFVLLATGLLAMFGILRRRPIRAMMEG